MACIIVPGTEAIVATAAREIVKRKENEAPQLEVKAEVEEDGKIPFSRKLKWLTNMLWGGTLLLVFEHVWHGEITAWFPFLTAASSKSETMVMLHEMSTVGVVMSVLVTAVWVGMVIISDKITSKSVTAESDAA